jgi:hypothetical protein
MQVVEEGMKEDGTISQHPSFLQIQRPSHSVYSVELQMARNNTFTGGTKNGWFYVAASAATMTIIRIVWDRVLYGIRQESGDGCHL